MPELLQVILLSGLAGAIIVLALIIMSKDKKLRVGKTVNEFNIVRYKDCIEELQAKNSKLQYKIEIAKQNIRTLQAEVEQLKQERNK